MTMHARADGSGPRAPDAFDCGRSWQCYIESYFDSDRIDIAARTRKDVLQMLCV